MKHYPKEYEDSFSPNVRYRLKKNGDPKCDLNKVKVYLDRMSGAEYQNRLRESMRTLELNLFDNIIKVYWLFRQFMYEGRRWKLLRHGIRFDMTFSYFIRSFIGFDQKVLTRSHVARVVFSYCEDFFPNFDEADPFEQKINYPYQYVTLSHLVLVHLMPERLELLAEAEKRKLGILQFLDYVINYIMCYNEEHGETYYYKIVSNAIPSIRIVSEHYAKIKARNLR